MQPKTIIERLIERIEALEAYNKALGDAEELNDRILMLEENIYTTKRVLTFTEACFYIGISESLLYQLTASKEIPHFKPHGKMLYFDKQELDAWLLQNSMPVPRRKAETETEAKEKEEKEKKKKKPYFKRDRYKRWKH